MRRSELWTSSIVVAELFSGVDLMPAGKRQQTLREKMEQMVSAIFTGRILTFNFDAARAYGPILAARQRMGSQSTKWTHSSPPPRSPMAQRWLRATLRILSTAGLRW
jgi:predicted nucleic acid-binding protein